MSHLLRWLTDNGVSRDRWGQRVSVMFSDKDDRPAALNRRDGDWRKAYARRVIVTDFLVLAWVIFGVQIAWFGFDSSDVAIQDSPEFLAVSYTVISVTLLCAWMLALSVYGTREFRVIGTGTQEYRLVADSAMRLFGILAIVAFLFQVSFARGYVLIAFPLGVAVLLFSRWMWRQWLGIQRARGQYSSRVLLAGSYESVRVLMQELQQRPEAGYMVAGAVVPGAHAEIAGVPVVGTLDSIVEGMARVGADTVVITSSAELPSDRVRDLSWRLEPGKQHLVVAPSLVDVGGPRIHTRPVSGLPLIHVETPRFEGGKRFAKRAFDIIVSGGLLILLLPLFAIIGMVVKTTSAGPVFYRQERIGRGGAPFQMLKFRSMRQDADALLLALLKEQGKSDQPLFKVENDPRVTQVGRFLRRHSLDEFPQLINVLKGDMSLVGPRPQRAAEVALYDERAGRRLVVQPGMTGLWQVSGRSSLSWEDAIRLDLFYVENWSLTADLILLLRTFRAVVVPGHEAH